MSEHEFEAYLNLLARTLRLSANQRDRIAGELRDHMEQRLDELTAAGVPRHDAALRALDEFGDAGALAHELSASARLKHRRRLMQTTFATATVAAVVTLGVMYLAPANRSGQPSQPLASAATPEQPRESRPADITVDRDPDPLGERISLNFENSTFGAVADYLHSELNLNIVVDWQGLEVAGVSPDTPVTMQLDSVPARTAIDVVLRLAGRGDVGTQRIDDDVLLIANRHNIQPALETRTYDCTPLVTAINSIPSQMRSSSTGIDREISEYLEESLNTSSTPYTTVAVIGGIGWVTDTPDAHARIERMLDEARAITAERSTNGQNDKVQAQANLRNTVAVISRELKNLDQEFQQADNIRKASLDKEIDQLAEVQIALESLADRLTGTGPR